MRANYGKPLRIWLKNKPIEEILDFGDLPVFKKATTYPCILRVSNGIPKPLFKVVQVNNLDFSDLFQYVEENEQFVNRESLNDNGWSLVDQEKRLLLDKLMKSGTSLGEYVKEKIFYGVKTGLNKAFVINEATKDRLIAEDPKSAEVIKPFLEGKEIKKYVKLKTKNYLILFEKGISNKKGKEYANKWKWIEKTYPSVAAYLKPFEIDAEKRYDKGNYWWELRTCDYYSEFEKDKIIYPNICKKPEFTFDNESHYTNQKCFIISKPDKYLLGLLNSKLNRFLFEMILPKLRGGFFEPSYVFFKNFPIHTIDFSSLEDVANYDKMVYMVEQMLEMNKKLDNSKLASEKEMIKRRIESVDSEINRLVYKLYKLTEEEIKIIEMK